tara:strand:+ start:1886 stop:2248 length:363 start_codon:yes stop_codon:yes gene_type:complete
MARRKRDKKYLVKMEVSAVATQTMSGYITQEQFNEFMKDFDESYLRLEVSMDDTTEFTDWEYDALDLERITIEDGDCYKPDWCWLKGENLNDHPLVRQQKKRLQRVSIIDEEIKRLQNMP